MIQSNATGQLSARYICLICAVIFMLQGCPPAITWVKDNGGGTSGVYPAPFQVVWDAIPVVFNDLGLVKVDESKKKGFFLAQGKMSLLSNGEKISVFVEKVDATNTKVKVISRRVWSNDTAAENWEDPILNNLNELLVSPPPAN